MRSKGAGVIRRRYESKRIDLGLRVWLVALTATAIATIATDARAEDLRGPVDLSTRRQTYGEALSNRSCPPIVALPRALTSISFYVDPPFYSRIDPVREREFYAAIAPIRDAEEAIATALTSFVRADGGHGVAFAECALAHLTRFATDNAMVETTESRGSGQVRLFSVPPLFAFTVLAEGGSISDEQAQLVKTWIRRLVERMTQYQQEYWYGNNIDYWGAAGMSLAAVALNDRNLLIAALEVGQRALDEVTHDGVLPKEMARGDRALEYNLFATQAMAVMLAVSERNNLTAFRNRNNSAVLRLMRTMATSVKTPQSFVTLSHNAATVLPEHIYTQNLAWVALADRFLPTDRTIRDVYCTRRPLYSFRAGGDWDVFFGTPTRCR